MLGGRPIIFVAANSHYDEAGVIIEHILDICIQGFLEAVLGHDALCVNGASRHKR